MNKKIKTVLIYIGGILSILTIIGTSVYMLTYKAYADTCVPEPSKRISDSAHSDGREAAKAESVAVTESSADTVEVLSEKVNETSVHDGWSENERAIFDALIDNGLTNAGAAAVMGCMAMESGFNPTAENLNDGGYGLLQWTGDRRDGLFSWCYVNGRDLRTVDGQTAFFVHELANRYSSANGYGYPVYETLTSSDDVEECLRMFFSHAEAGFDVRISDDNVYTETFTTAQLYCQRLDAAYKYL